MRGKRQRGGASVSTGPSEGQKEALWLWCLNRSDGIRRRWPRKGVWVWWEVPLNRLIFSNRKTRVSVWVGKTFLGAHLGVPSRLPAAAALSALTRSRAHRALGCSAPPRCLEEPWPAPPADSSAPRMGASGPRGLGGSPHRLLRPPLPVGCSGSFPSRPA